MKFFFVINIIILKLLFSQNIFSSNLIEKKDGQCKESMAKSELIDLTYDFHDQDNEKETFNCAFILVNEYDDVEGYSWLGYLYYYGHGTKVDLKQSYNYSKIAAERGDIYATLDLAELHYGTQNLEVTDFEKSYHYLKKSYFELENFDALSELVRVTYYGIGTIQNYIESFRLLDEYDLSELTNYQKYMLAEHYIRGVGTKQNIDYGVSILESLDKDGYSSATEDLNLLYGRNFEDKKNRKLKSFYFYQKDRDIYLHYGYDGYEKTFELDDLMTEETAFEALKYAIDLINSYINDGTSLITGEVCYAIGNIGYIQDTFGPFSDTLEDELLAYEELGYQKNCRGVNDGNYVNDIIWETDKPDYKRAIDICLNDIKNSAGSTACIEYIGYFFQEGFVYDVNPFNAYVLLEFSLQNAMISLDVDTEWTEDRLEELAKVLEKEQIIEAKLVVDEINNDFEKIFPYLYDNVDKKYKNDYLQVKEAPESNSNEEIIPEYQREILNTRSSSDELEKVATVVDKEPPIIEINESVDFKGNVASLSFRVSDDSNIEAVFIDNQPVQIKETNNGIVEVIQTIYIGDKDKEIVITAYDKWGKNSNKSIILAKTQESFDINYGEYYALIIGNNNYKYLPKLKTAVNDAEVLSKILDDKYNFKEVILLRNASRKEILTELYKFQKKLSFKDNFLIYYAGHGEIDRQLNQGYWQPVDAEPDLPIEWIDNNTIASVISTIKSKHVLVIADSCYAGLLTRGSSGYDNEVYENRKIYLERMSGKKSRLIFTSGGKEPVVDGGGGNHSPFAKSLINILNDIEIETTISDISKKITSFVITNYDQTPEYSPLPKSGHDGGEFIFVPRI